MKKTAAVFIFILCVINIFSQDVKKIKKNSIEGVKSELLVPKSFTLHKYTYNGVITIRDYEEQHVRFDSVYPIYESVVTFGCLNRHNRTVIHKRYVYVDKNYNFIYQSSRKRSFMSFLYTNF
jgi:hypothetical protein